MWTHVIQCVHGGITQHTNHEKNLRPERPEEGAIGEKLVSHVKTVYTRMSVTFSCFLESKKEPQLVLHLYTTMQINYSFIFHLSVVDVGDQYKRARYARVHE